MAISGYQIQAISSERATIADALAVGARRLFLRLLPRFPLRLRRLAGTTVVTAVGMFAGKGGGWALGIVPLHTLGVTIGGIVERPAVEAGQLVTHEHLALTISVDHDVVDGAPAARFVRSLREAMETAGVVDRA